jgi:ATP-dependent Clp protease ATP-binding subunit ClpB
LRRFIAREVETRVARALVADAVPDGALIRVDAPDDELTVQFLDGGAP